MKQEQVLGVARHILTFVGGILVMKGVVDDQTITELIGGVITFAGVVWSFVDKVKK
jgi:hypothetical protein